jgi:hypothetical protein
MDYSSFTLSTEGNSREGTGHFHDLEDTDYITYSDQLVETFNDDFAQFSWDFSGPAMPAPGLDDFSGGMESSSSSFPLGLPTAQPSSQVSISSAGHTASHFCNSSEYYLFNIVIVLNKFII